MAVFVAWRSEKMATNWNAVLANITNSADILAILRKVLGLLDGKVDSTKVDETLAGLEKLAEDGQLTIKEALNSIMLLEQRIEERTAAFNEAIEIAAAAGAGANGWTADLVAYNNQTQAQFNDKYSKFKQIETGAIERDLSVRARDIQYVDDYSSLQSAFNAKRTDTIDIKIGKKQYILSSPLSISSYHFIEGAGFNSDLKFTAAGSGLVYTAASGVQDDHSQRYLGNFQIRGNNTVGGYLDAKNGTTIGYQYTSTGHFSDTYNMLFNGHEIGLKIEKSFTNRNNHAYYRSCKTGLYLKDTTSHREDMVYARYNSDHAILIEGTTQNVHFSGGAIEGNRGTAITWRAIPSEAFPKLILDDVYFESAGDKAANVPAISIQEYARMHVDVRGGNLWNNSLSGIVTGAYKWGNSVSFSGSTINGFHYAKRMRVRDCTDYALYNTDYELSNALLTGLAEPTLMLEYCPAYRDNGIGPVFQVPLAGRSTKYLGTSNEATLNYPHILSKSPSVSTSENLGLNYGEGSWTDINFTVGGSYNNDYAQLSNIIDSTSDYPAKVFVFLLRPSADCKIGIISAGSQTQNVAYFSLKANTTYRICCLANRISSGNYMTRIFSIDGACILSYFPIFLGKYKRTQDAINTANMFCLGAV